MSNNQIDNTRIIYNKNEPTVNLRLQGQWVDNTTPLSAANLNAMLEAIKTSVVEVPKLENKVNEISEAIDNIQAGDVSLVNYYTKSDINEKLEGYATDGELKTVSDNLDNLTGRVATNETKISTLEQTGTKTKKALSIKYNTNINGVVTEQQVSFNGEAPVDVDLTHLASGGGGGDVSVSASSNTGFTFINNELNWDTSVEDILGLTLVLDGGEYSTWFEETPVAEVYTLRESVSSSYISANINTGLEFVNNNLQWSSDELIPGLVLIMDGGTFADL